MKISRRRFLALGSGAVAATTTGCDQAKVRGTGLMRWFGKPTHPPLEGLLTAPASTEIDEASHFLNRLTFGPRPGDYARVTQLGTAAFLEEQLAPEKLDDWMCERIVRHEFDTLAEPESRLFPRKGDDKDPLLSLFSTMKHGSARVGDLFEYKEKILLNELTGATIVRAAFSTRQLFEVMVQFWSDHFNIDPSKGDCKFLKTADDRDVIRTHALGNFRDLVRASAVSPAMLWYLDGRANMVRGPGDKPNENYARELMELHTLGVGSGYTQQDVMEVARCLTGWTVREQKRFFKGRVEFDAKGHDDGAKSVLGETIPAGLGARDLDRVLEIVTAHPNCAKFIATKLCRRFIADEPPEAAISATAKTFAESKGDIRTTLRALFATPEFLAPETRGVKFKRPFHFVVCALRGANAQTNGAPPLVEYLQRLGHAPFRYPTPDGYPEEATHWKSTLLWRWNFAAAFAENRIKGTQIAYDDLREKLGSDDALIATFLGRQPTTEERTAFQQSGAGLALLIASPAFQRC
jgi:uncharacterized protein (DUF1800 family)